MQKKAAWNTVISVALETNLLMFWFVIISAVYLIQYVSAKMFMHACAFHPFLGSTRSKSPHGMKYRNMLVVYYWLLTFVHLTPPSLQPIYLTERNKHLFIIKGNQTKPNSLVYGEICSMGRSL